MEYSCYNFLKNLVSREEKMSKIILERNIKEVKGKNGKSYFLAKLGDWDAVIDESLCLAFKGDRIPYFLSGKIPHFIEGAEAFVEKGTIFIKPSLSYNLFILELDYDCPGGDSGISLSPVDPDSIVERIDFSKLSDARNRFFDTVGSVFQVRSDSLILKKTYYEVYEKPFRKPFREWFSVEKVSYLYLDAKGVEELDFLLE
jgi:hypothetical protein